MELYPTNVWFRCIHESRCNWWKWGHMRSAQAGKGDFMVGSLAPAAKATVRDHFSGHLCLWANFSSYALLQFALFSSTFDFLTEEPTSTILQHPHCCLYWVRFLVENHSHTLLLQYWKMQCMLALPNNTLQTSITVDSTKSCRSMGNVDFIVPGRMI